MVSNKLNNATLRPKQRALSKGGSARSHLSGRYDTRRTSEKVARFQEWLLTKRSPYILENAHLRGLIEAQRNAEEWRLRLQSVCKAGLCDYEELMNFLRDKYSRSAASWDDLLEYYYYRLMQDPELVREELQKFHDNEILL